jgi:hypothetical protein
LYWLEFSRESEPIEDPLIGRTGPPIMKAEKLHDLPSASWRPMKASGIFQSKLKDLEIETN